MRSGSFARGGGVHRDFVNRGGARIGQRGFARQGFVGRSGGSFGRYYGNGYSYGYGGYPYSYYGSGYGYPYGGYYGYRSGWCYDPYYGYRPCGYSPYRYGYSPYLNFSFGGY